MSRDGYLEFASYLLFWLCFLKIQVAAVASAALLPDALLAANEFGVPHWLPAVVSIALGAAAVALMTIDSSREQRSAAWVLCLAGCAYADRPLGLCDWWSPQFELGLWLAIPWSFRYLRRGGPKRARRFRLALAVLPVFGFLTVAPYFVLGPERWHLWPIWIPCLGGYGGPLLLACYAAASRRRLTLLLRAVAVICSLALLCDIVLTMNTSQALLILSEAIGFASYDLFETEAVVALATWVQAAHRQDLIATEPGEKMIAAIAVRIRGPEIGDRLREWMAERETVNTSDIVWLQEPEQLGSNTPIC